MLGDDHLAALARGFAPSSKLRKLIIAGNLMTSISLDYLCEALKLHRCKLHYLDIGNHPSIKDQDFTSFCSLLEHSNVKLDIETLVLKGNTALKYSAGMAIKRLVEVHRIKRVNLENTSVPLNVIDKVNQECEFYANRNTEGLRQLELEIQKQKQHNAQQINENQGDGGILNVFMGRRKSRGQILRDFDSELHESKDVILQGRIQT